MNSDLQIGIVIAGSLSEGVKVKLFDKHSVETMTVGANVIIESDARIFFGVITDIELESSDPYFQSLFVDDQDVFLKDTLLGTVVYGIIKVEPMLTLGENPYMPGSNVEPAKTIPGHFSIVRTAEQNDIYKVFGKESNNNFWVGSPVDMPDDVLLCLDIEKLISRNTGIFGKTGSGKTFIARILLSGIIKSNLSSNLIFDMHNDYGWAGTSEINTEVKGLKQLFSSDVLVHSLDSNTRNTNNSPDEIIKIKYSDIEPADIKLLKDTIDLTPLAVDATYSLKQHLNNNWFRDFISMSATAITDLSDSVGVHPQTLLALKRGLTRLTRYDFMVDDHNLEKHKSHQDFAAKVIEKLRNGFNVVLNFGKYANDKTAYILVANILTRRIYNQYKRDTEFAIANSNPNQHPRNLVITIEEAHLFLDPSVANETIFGNIAREMRKYHVTLLVVDQRPSQIDDDIMSQIGTKISCLLDSGKDVDAVLSGVPGGRKLRGILARLDSNQQALIVGHAVPMSVAIKTRLYNEKFYEAIGPSKTIDQINQDKKNLGL
jgi:DNA helicase HerA-like ATPase